VRPEKANRPFERTPRKTPERFLQRMLLTILPRIVPSLKFHVMEAIAASSADFWRQNVGNFICVFYKETVFFVVLPILVSLWLD
jgi:hypothetical protein